MGMKLIVNSEFEKKEKNKKVTIQTLSDVFVFQMTMFDPIAAAANLSSVSDNVDAAAVAADAACVNTACACVQTAPHVPALRYRR